jgi:hypothetical protein
VTPRPLVAALQPAMSQRGLHWRGRDDWFFRRVDGVQHRVQLLSVDHPPAVDVEPQLMVRHDLVERIFHRTSGYSAGTQADTPTVGGDLHALVPGTPGRLEIGPDGDVTAAVDQLTAALPEIERYWARYSDLPEIDRDLNEDRHRPAANRPLPWLRCSTGLIVARLVGRGDYDACENDYRQLLATNNAGFYLGRFEALAADLRLHTPAELRAAAT